MKNGVPQHPEAQVMAAFVDGTLAPAEVAQVAAHLRDCSDCRTVVAETARFEREESRPQRRWLLAVAASVLVVLAIAPFLLRSRSPMHQLIAASPRDHRTVDARLSGFAWARLAAPERGTAAPDPADLKLAGAAGDVMEKSKDEHAIGVAYLLVQQRSDAITALQRAAEHSSDAHVWNDLAAARYAYAMRDDHPAQLPEALADADHALRINPKLAEALFNRALIVEAIGLRDEARTAWQRYLDGDHGSGWAVEAREHLRKLDQHSRRDAAPAAEFAREARRRSNLLLSEWADDPTDEKLARVRAIANALVAFNGDHIVVDTVSAIEHADTPTRSALAAAHRAFRDGRAALPKLRATEAETAFRRAAALFAQGRSPMANVSRFYTANAELFQNRTDDARREHSALLASIDAARYPSLAAEVHWELAVEANIAGNWGTAIREANAASSALTSLHELSEAAEAEAVGLHALEVVGDADAAWKMRLQALARFEGEPWRERRIAILQGSATALRAIDRDAASDAMLDLIIAESGDGSIRLRALAELARGKLDAARASALRIADPKIREATQVRIDLASASSPADADRAANYFESHDLLALLPDALLRRARAHRAAGNGQAALNDYEEAMAAVEKQRSTIGESTYRDSFLDTAAQIVDDTIEFHLSRGDVASAFRVADRVKGGDGALDASCLIEYASLRHSLAIFCVSRGRLTGARIPIERTSLNEQIDEFIEKIRRRADDAQESGAALERILIAPLALNYGDEITIVPDRHLNMLPFAALYDGTRHRYLVEAHSIRLAPNSRAGDAATSAIAPALVISDPATQTEARLLGAREEAKEIAALHHATLLSGDAATRIRFIAAAEESALIHYSGHAQSDVTTSYGELLLAHDGSDAGIIDAADIAKLHLNRHPLVVLAACGTLRGNADHVTGMTSVSRAFLAAGARAVTGTLWEIDDDVAAVFFRRFHEQLRTSGAPATALREVQLEMLRSSDVRTRQPATWAPVEVLGHV